jgi:hypothetical protein
MSSVNLLNSGISTDQALVLASILKVHAVLKSLCGNNGDETELDMSGKNISAAEATMLAAEIAVNGALSPGLPLEVGHRVEARCAVDGKTFIRDRWFEGVVEAVIEPAEVYSILFDDGDRQPKVQRYQIRRKRAKRLTPYEKDEKVDARHGGGKKLYPGRIDCVNADHSYDVSYADGDKEEGVPIEMIFGLQNDVHTG